MEVPGSSPKFLDLNVPSHEGNTEGRNDENGESLHLVDLIFIFAVVSGSFIHMLIRSSSVKKNKEGFLLNSV